MAMAFWRWLTRPRTPRTRTHEDFAAEVQAHLDLEADRLEADGLSPDEARAAAHRAFGNVTLVRERFYETSRWTWLEQLWQDVRYAARGMRRQPSFVATAVLTLALGIGLLTIAFTVFNAYVLRPFAIRDPHGLYRIVWHARDDGGQQYRWREYEDLRQRRDLFSAVIGEHARYVASSDGRPLMAAFVSPNYFDALGPAMALGRGLGEIDADGRSGDAAVLSHDAWQRLFNGEPSAIGQVVELNGRHHTIVGVLAPAFSGLGDMPRDVFVPAATDVRDTRDPRGPRETEITVRLQAGINPIQAEAALTPFLNRMFDLQDRSSDARGARGAREARDGQVRAEIRPQSGPNPMSVEMLARAIARHRDIALRLSIGASRGRVVRQMLTEGLLIAGLAGLVSLGVAAVGLRLARVALFSTLPPSLAAMLRVSPTPLDHRVFLFALIARRGAGRDRERGDGAGVLAG
jgi:hypothetical protein